MRGARAALAALALTLLPPGAGGALPAQAEGRPLPSLAPMLERTTPAVVNISTRTRVRGGQSPLLSDPFFRRFFDLPEPRRRRTQSLGSGVVVDAGQGYVLTNSHVVDKAEEITVTLQDGRQLNAVLVGQDPETDVAVIQVPPEEGLTALPFADSDALRVGDFVVAVGNPFGLGQTVTSGIVSALGRTGLGIEGYEDFIQTDASINPGNSGGPLVNLRGELVGINTAILAPSGGNVGIGFAIPANMAREVMTQLVNHGEVRRGELGVTAQDLTPALAAAFDLTARQGAVVVEVEPGSPAAEAGLRPGDIVVGVNGREVENAADVRNAVGLLRAGREITLDILRDGRARTLTTRLAERAGQGIPGGDLDPHLEGAAFAEVKVRSQSGAAARAVAVVAVAEGSRAWRSGLREGDLVLGVNRVRIDSLRELRQAIDASRSGMTLSLRRGGSTVYIVLR